MHDELSGKGMHAMWRGFLGHDTLAANPLKSDWFRDKCEGCGLWTIFEMSLKQGRIYAHCSRCHHTPDMPFADTVTEAKTRAREINERVACLELEYPQLLRLRSLGSGVELPWFVERDDNTEMPSVAALLNLCMPPPRVARDAANLSA